MYARKNCYICKESIRQDIKKHLLKVHKLVRILFQNKTYYIDNTQYAMFLKSNQITKQEFKKASLIKCETHQISLKPLQAVMDEEIESLSLSKSTSGLAKLNDLNEILNVNRNFKPFTWQKTIIQRIQNQEDRKISFLSDTEGNTGKTFLSTNLRNYIGYIYVSIADTNNVLQIFKNIYFIYCLLHKKQMKEEEKLILLIDLSRAFNERHLKNLSSHLENAKNGNIGGHIIAHKTAILILTNFSVADIYNKMNFSNDRYDVISAQKIGKQNNPPTEDNILLYECPHKNSTITFNYNAVEIPPLFLSQVLSFNIPYETIVTNKEQFLKEIYSEDFTGDLTPIINKLQNTTDLQVSDSSNLQCLDFNVFNNSNNSSDGTILETENLEPEINIAPMQTRVNNDEELGDETPEINFNTTSLEVREISNELQNTTDQVSDSSNLQCLNFNVFNNSNNSSDGTILETENLEPEINIAPIQTFVNNGEEELGDETPEINFNTTSLEVREIMNNLQNTTSLQILNNCDLECLNSDVFNNTNNSLNSTFLETEHLEPEINIAPIQTFVNNGEEELGKTPQINFNTTSLENREIINISNNTTSLENENFNNLNNSSNSAILETEHLEPEIIIAPIQSLVNNDEELGNETPQINFNTNSIDNREIINISKNTTNTKFIQIEETIENADNLEEDPQENVKTLNTKIGEKRKIEDNLEDPKEKKHKDLSFVLKVDSKPSVYILNSMCKNCLQEKFKCTHNSNELELFKLHIENVPHL